MRQALGEEALIRLDANGAWTEAQAVKRLRKLEHFGVELVEQPVATLEQLASVRQADACRGC